MNNDSGTRDDNVRYTHWLVVECQQRASLKSLMSGFSSPHNQILSWIKILPHGLSSSSLSQDRQIASSYHLSCAHCAWGGECKGRRRQGEDDCRQGAGEPLLEGNRPFLRVDYSPPTHRLYLTVFFHLCPADWLIKWIPDLQTHK